MGAKGEVESPFLRAGKGQEVLLEGWNGPGGPPVGPGRAGSPSQRSCNGWEALPEGWQESGGPPVGTGGIGRPFRRSWQCRAEVDGIPWTRGNLTDVHAAARKVPGKSSGHTECLWKVQRRHKNLTEFDGRSSSCTKLFRKFLRMAKS